MTIEKGKRNKEKLNDLVFIKDIPTIYNVLIQGTEDCLNRIIQWKLACIKLLPL